MKEKGEDEEEKRGEGGGEGKGGDRKKKKEEEGEKRRRKKNSQVGFEPMQDLTTICPPKASIYIYKYTYLSLTVIKYLAISTGHCKWGRKRN